MNTRRSKSWELDWAGPHGTAWGTFNACSGACAVSIVAHLVMANGGASPAAVALGVAGGVVLGVIVALFRTALRTARTPGATVVYKIACWVGVGLWVGWVAWHDSQWALGWWLGQCAILAGLALAAGLVAGLADEDPTSEPTPPAVEMPAGLSAAEAERATIAAQWAARIRRVCSIDVKILGVEQWPNNAGFTLDVELPEGGHRTDDLRTASGKLAADADLPNGCPVVVTSGASRRRAVIDVTTVNAISQDQPYPEDLSPLTINGPVPIGIRSDFTIDAVELRQRCLVVVGEAGSGKTNFLHTLSAGLARCNDNLTWHIDLTGAGLSRPWLRPWLAGHADRPAVDAVADTGQKALQMTAAALRIGHARKAAYQDLMAQVDDDKMPISPTLPQITIIVDEIANITGNRSEYPQLRDNLIQIMRELRASGIRVVLAGLRATDDVILNSVLSLCPVRIGMKMATRAELAWLFEWKDGLSPEDAPYPGSGFVRHESGGEPTPYRAYRIKPSYIGTVALATDAWRPGLDAVSEAAANGRGLDGIPLLDEAGNPLPDDDLGWYATRWDGWSAAPSPTVVIPVGEVPASPPPYTGPRSTPEEARAGIDVAVRELREHNAALTGADPKQHQHDREEFDRIIGGNVWGDIDPAEPSTWSKPPELDPPKGAQDRMLALIAARGDSGLGPKELLAELAGEGIVISRDTLHTWLRDALAAGKVTRPQHGKWIRRHPDAGVAP